MLAVCGLLAWAGMASTPFADGVSVTAVADGPTIYRETPDGLQRLVYLSIANETGKALADLAFYTRAGDEWLERRLIDVPAEGAWDTVWLKAPVPAKVTARLTRGGVNFPTDFDALKTHWQGELAIAKPVERCVIPMSQPVAEAQMGPLMLRGTNYYPRHNPWPGLWRKMTEKDFESELTELDALHINTLRTFYNIDTEENLHREDGTFTPLLLSRVNTFLAVAERHRMKVQLCVVSVGQIPFDDLDRWRRYIRTGVEPFIYDGRILMWDLMNEPGGYGGPKATPELARWVQLMYRELRRIAPNHMLTVGLCWQFDQLWDLGVIPDVGHLHNYSRATGVQPEGEPPVRNVADDLREVQKRYTGDRPLIIGEFGYGSVPNDEYTDCSETEQERITRDVLIGSEAAGITGTYNWCAFHFAPDWMGGFEQSFGVIRPDGQLKPAGVVLRDTYARWKAKAPAPWETDEKK